jgi:ribonuclease E
MPEGQDGRTARMLDNEPTGGPEGTAPQDASTDSTSTSGTAPRTRRRAASRPAGPVATAPPASETPAAASAEAGESEPKPKRTRTTKKTAAKKPAAEPAQAPAETAAGPSAESAADGGAEPTDAPTARTRKKAAPVIPTFQAPDPVAAPVRKRAAKPPAAESTSELEAELDEVSPEPDGESEGTGTAGPARRSRGRRGRGGRGRGEAADATSADDETAEPVEGEEGDADEGGDGYETVTNADGTTTRRRRRRRRRRGGGGGGEDDTAVEDGVEVVVHVREPRQRKPRGGGGGGGGGADRDSDDEVRGVQGSTRLEARKQRRREGRDQGRKRVPIITEAEFLARRESVDRVMVVRQTAERTQVAVLEDGILVEHFVSKTAASSYVGNVYLGRVQNVLPSMEAAFVDIGKGRNAVLYAGEVNWDAAGLEGQPRRIETALKAGQPVLVQVTKDPIGHKGARLTSQVSLPGRFVALVPDGTMTGISRKLPENERTRLKSILKQVMPEGAGVIVRTAAEGASEEELTRDINRLSAQWADIQAKAETGEAPALLYAEPDLTVRVIRDVFNEDFAKVIVQGADEWDMIEAYVSHVAPDLAGRLEKWVGTGDAFAEYRVDEQIAKGLDRKVWLPSGGSLVIDRTEAMTVIDVNTGKFTGSGGSNLEETVTRNNLEAAEEIVRQMRLRDIGGMIVVDFIDMVLESNRDLVLRRLTEALGRDRTRHQVSEVTSLGLVQMTRKKLGTGLVEAFSTTCEHCHGRGIIVHNYPVETAPAEEGSGRREGRRRRKDKDRDKDTKQPSTAAPETADSHPEEEAAVKRAHPVALAMAAHHTDDEVAEAAAPVEAKAEPSPQAKGSRDSRRGRARAAAAEVTESAEAEAVRAEPVHAEAAESVVAAGRDGSEPVAEPERPAQEPATEREPAVTGRIGAQSAQAEPASTPASAETKPVETKPDEQAPEAGARRGRRRVARTASAPSTDSRGAVFVLTDADQDSAPKFSLDELAPAEVTPRQRTRRRAAGRAAGAPESPN